jgi:hypothetical protein
MPADFVGERHVVIVKREQGESADYEWIEAEERPGPAPPGSVSHDATVFLSEDDSSSEFAAVANHLLSPAIILSHGRRFGVQKTSVF